MENWSIRQLLEKANKVNVVQALVEVEHLNTRKTERLICLNAQHILDFSILGLDFFRDPIVSIYQIRLRPSYIQELQREESEKF